MRLGLQIDRPTSTALVCTMAVRQELKQHHPHTLPDFAVDAARRAGSNIAPPARVYMLRNATFLGFSQPVSRASRSVQIINQRAFTSILLLTFVGRDSRLMAFVDDDYRPNCNVKR
jgi:hypothetical protein